MAYLKTILTYHLPSEAEIDKSLLESHGLTVNLLNNNEARNELGAPFHIQLQVPDEEVAQAVAVLKEFNPQRFGSMENVRTIEKELAGKALKLVGYVVVIGGLVFALSKNPDMESRLFTAVISGLVIGTLGFLGVGVVSK